MEGEKRGDLLRDSRVCFKVHAPVRYAKAKGDPCSAFCRRYRSAIPLQYGAGLRNVKCLRLRIRDIDFSRNEIHIGDGKDRIAVLSQTWESHLQDHPKAVKVTHAKGILEEQGRVRIPMALDEKYPNRRIA